MLPFNAGAATGMAANAVIAGSAWVAQAGLAAAAWIVAMAPVALAVAAVAVAIAAVVTAQSQIKSISAITSDFDKDTLQSWWKSLSIPEKAISLVSYKKRKRELGLAGGGIVGQMKYASGGLAQAANGMIAGHSALRDRVPAMLTPGELVLNKDQQKKLLTGGSGGQNITTNVNINVGTMIATPGERREFVRMIEKLMNE